jgi:hypothetical protein
MSKKHLRLSFGLLMYATLGCGAQAQLNKQVRWGNYYEDQAQASGGSSTTVNFAQTPSDKFLTVQTVTCAINSSVKPLVGFFNLGATPGGRETGRMFALPVSGNYSITAGNQYYTNFVVSTLFKSPGNRYISISIGGDSTTNGSMIVFCTIAGTLSDN